MMNIELCVSSIHKYLSNPFETAKGIILAIEEDRSLPHLFFAVAAYIDRHAFRARAKEVYHVDTMRLSERARSEG